MIKAAQKLAIAAALGHVVNGRADQHGEEAERVGSDGRELRSVALDRRNDDERACADHGSGNANAMNNAIGRELGPSAYSWDRDINRHVTNSPSAAIFYPWIKARK